MRSLNPHENRAPRLVSQTHYCVMGDVSVAANAVIAPGVVLHASPGSRIVIASGACLAGGVCIQSRKGVLTIGAGANLGANVLVVGHGSVGERACVSPGTTLMNPQVVAESLIPPGSLVVSSTQSAQKEAQSRSTTSFVSAGFTSGSYVSNVAEFTASHAAKETAKEQVTVSQQNDSFVNTFVEPPPIGPKPIETPSLADQNGQYIDPSSQSNGVQLNGSYSEQGLNGSERNGSRANGSAANSSALSVAGNQHVYGKDQVNQLLSTLFPNRVQ